MPRPIFPTPTAVRIAVVAALLLCAPASGRSAEKPLDVIDKDLKAIDAQLKNAGMKLKYVAGGNIRKPGALNRRSEKAAVTPTRSCCMRNVESLHTRLGSIESAIRDLRERADRKGDDQAIEALSHMTEVHTLMKKALEQFAMASDAPYAQVVLKDMRASTTHFREAKVKYVDCCGERGGSEDEPVEGAGTDDDGTAP